MVTRVTKPKSRPSPAPNRALLPLGITRLYAEGEPFAGHGAGEKAFFWIGQRAGRPREIGGTAQAQ